MTEAPTGPERPTSGVRPIAFGGLLVILGQAFGLGFNVLNRLLVARGLTLHDFGLLSLATTIANILLGVLAVGFSTAITRSVGFYSGRYDADCSTPFAKISVALGLGTGCIASFALAGVSPLLGRVFHDVELVGAVQLAAIPIPFVLCLVFLAAVLTGRGNVKLRVALYDFGLNLLRVAFVAVAFAIHISLRAILWAYALAAVTACWIATYFLLLRPKPVPGVVPMRTYLRAVLVVAGPLLLSGVLETTTLRANTLIIGYYHGPATVGILDLAGTISSILNFPVVAFATAYLPLASIYAAKGQYHAIALLYGLCAKWSFLLGLPVAAAFMLAPEGTLNLAFGSKFASSSRSLAILALANATSALCGPGAAALVAMQRTQYLTFGITCGLGLNLLLSWALVPQHGAAGAALALLAGQLITQTTLMIWAHKFCGVHPFVGGNWKSVASAAAVLAAFRIATWLGVLSAQAPVTAGIMLVGTAVAVVAASGLFATAEEKDLYRAARARAAALSTNRKNRG